MTRPNTAKLAAQLIEDNGADLRWAFHQAIVAGHSAPITMLFDLRDFGTRRLLELLIPSAKATAKDLIRHARRNRKYPVFVAAAPLAALSAALILQSRFSAAGTGALARLAEAHERSQHAPYFPVAAFVQGTLIVGGMHMASPRNRYVHDVVWSLREQLEFMYEDGVRRGLTNPAIVLIPRSEKIGKDFAAQRWPDLPPAEQAIEAGEVPLVAFSLGAEDANAMVTKMYPHDLNTRNYAAPNTFPLFYLEDKRCWSLHMSIPQALAERL